MRDCVLRDPHVLSVIGRQSEVTSAFTTCNSQTENRLVLLGKETDGRMMRKADEA